MPRCNPRSDPERFRKIQLEQQQIKQEYGSSVTMARRCPYCLHRVEILYRGNHGMSQTRCQKCGEEIFFPPASFRLA